MKNTNPPLIPVLFFFLGASWYSPETPVQSLPPSVRADSIPPATDEEIPYKLSAAIVPMFRDSAAQPVDRYFPWWTAGDKQRWLEVARDWNTYDFRGAATAAEMCDSLRAKSETAWAMLGEVKRYGLPDSSIFFEYLDWHERGVRQNRALVLWVERPVVRFSTDGSDKGCAAAIYGRGELLGNTALLLLDTKRERVIQRVHTIAGGDNDPVFRFCAPFSNQQDAAYHCSLQKEDPEFNDFGIATVLYPHDLDGDGLAAEFLFYRYEGCGVNACAVIAYDPGKDKLVQRPFQLQVTVPAWKTRDGRSDSTYLEKTNWVYQFPLEARASDGRIRYVKEVGHGSPVNFHYDFKYDRAAGCFVGTLMEKVIAEE